MKKVLKFAKWLLIALAALTVVFGIGFNIYTRNYYKADKEVIASIEKSLDHEVHMHSDKNGMVFIPEGQDYKAVIVFYPGGKVEYSSYSGLMYKLADKGYICLLPKMPKNLAFLRTNAGEVITRGHEDESATVRDLDWYLAGHSLGGVAASLFLNETSDTYAGLILCASYPNADFSDTDIRLLSIIGSEDKVLNREAYESAKACWPEASDEYMIEGGIHSYFGCYGIQSKDGEPAISNEEQIRETADIIEKWIENNSGYNKGDRHSVFQKEQK